MSKTVYNLFSPPTVLLRKAKIILTKINKFKVMIKPQIDNAATFSDSNVGLEPKTAYIAVVVGSSVNETAAETNRDRMNLLLGTIKKSVVEEKGAANIQPSDWVTRTASSRSLVEAGVISADQKSKAMRDGTLFEVSFRYTDRVIGQDANGNDRFAKKYDAKVVNEEDLQSSSFFLNWCKNVAKSQEMV